MGLLLQHWRKENGLTQKTAAALLEVSQPYLSLLEKGSRPLTKELQARLATVDAAMRGEQKRDNWPSQLSALGYPPFRHVHPARDVPEPGALLMSVLSASDADARVAEALPWLVRRYSGVLDLNALIRSAKLFNLQNRLGFVLALADVSTLECRNALRELDRSRLVKETTFCWDSMPRATKDWMRKHRSRVARHWRVLTMLQGKDVVSSG